MNSTASIATLDNVTLVTLQDFPGNAKSISQIFDDIAKLGINIDMISMSPAPGLYTGLSFTISDEKLSEMLVYTAEIKKKLNLSVIVSSSNYKLSVYDEAMRHTPGVAAKVFKAINNTDADIRLITTSEVEISLLVSEADFDNVYTEIKSAFI